MKPPATREHLPADVQAALLWCSELIALDGRLSFYSRLLVESRSNGEKSLERFCLGMVGILDARFWSLAVKMPGIRLGRVKSADLVAAARRYVAEYRH